MAVSRLPAPPRSRPASVDARAIERESRAAAAAAARKEGQAQADSFWCGCMSRPSAVSPPPLQKRSSGKNTTDGKSSKCGAGESRDNGTSGDRASSLEFRSSDTVLKSTDHFRSTDTTRIAADGKPLELKGSGDSYIQKKFTTLAEGLELRPTSPFRPRLSPGKVSPLIEQLAAESAGNSPPTAMPQASFSTYSKGNGNTSNIGSSPPVDRTKSSPSPTLFEMMAHEQELQQQQQPPPKPLLLHCQQALPLQPLQLPAAATTMPGPQPSMQEKVSGILSGSSPGNQFNDAASSDLKLTLSSKDGYSVTVCVHRQVLVANSRFFAAKLSDRWSKHQRTFPHLVEISDCEDVELYLETLRLMYCCDMKRTLMKETVVRVLGMLKVSAAIVFEAGVVSCLEFLEAVPWAEDEEEKITSLLSQLQLESVGANEVLKRCSAVEVINSEDILVRLLNSVTKGTDEKARREMKALVSRMLRENVSQNKEHFDVSKESLYKACHNCVDSLLRLFMQATSSDFATRNSEDRGCMIAQIARQADNLHWLVDILIDRRIADELVRLWAHQSELATLHMQVPTMYRYEVSRLTARFCIAIGKGQVVVPKDVRYLLLQTWLQPLVEDFGWMQRCCKVLDKKVVEEGISQTILTLPLKQQQTILLAWFDRFSNSGDDCPNLQRAFEVWWRRMFLRPHDEEGSHADSHAN